MISSTQYQSSSRVSTPSKQSVPASTAASPTISHEAIARRAYDIYTRNGRMPGHCAYNWHEAERELYGAAQHEGADRKAKNFDDVMPSNSGPGHSTPIGSNPQPLQRGPAKP